MVSKIKKEFIMDIEYPVEYARAMAKRTGEIPAGSVLGLAA